MPCPVDRIERIEVSSHPCANWQSIQSIEGSTREQAKVIAEILRGRMKTDDREIAADRQQHNSRAVPTESRIEFERAAARISVPKKRSGTVGRR